MEHEPTDFTLHPAEDTIRGWQRDLKNAYATIATLQFEARRDEDRETEAVYFCKCVAHAPWLPRLCYLFSGRAYDLVPKEENDA